MTILGIDPGLATVGFGVITQKAPNADPEFKDCGVIKTPPKISLGERLLMIKDDIEALLDEFKPDAVGIEELFFTKNVTNGLLVAHARGIIVEAVHRRGIPIYDFTPPQIKNNIAGSGAADKKQMQTMIQRLLNLNKVPKPDDAADALGVAICAGRMA